MSGSDLFPSDPAKASIYDYAVRFLERAKAGKVVAVAGAYATDDLHASYALTGRAPEKVFVAMLARLLDLAADEFGDDDDDDADDAPPVAAKRGGGRAN